MGAVNFTCEGQGNSLEEAFVEAREQAAWEHGHGGYTGSLAEKDSAIEARGIPDGMEAFDYADFLVRAEAHWNNQGAGSITGKIYKEVSCKAEDNWYRQYWNEKTGPTYVRLEEVWRGPLNDLQTADWRIFFEKWGPALAIPNGDGRWVFCGMASS